MNRYIIYGKFEKFFPNNAEPPQGGTVRSTLKKIDPEELRLMNNFIVKKSIQNKVFENGTIDKRIVASIDRT